MKKIPVSRQLEANDCGPACIKMIAHYYGRKYSLKDIKSFCEITRLGISLKDIVQCCKHIGLEAYTVKINMLEIKRMPLPAILFLKAGHFVILEKITVKKKRVIYHLIDPSTGRIKLEEEYFIEKVIVESKGIAAVLAPNSNFFDINKELETKKSYKILKLLKENYLKYKTKFNIILVFSILSMAANWISPLIFRKTVDDGIMTKDIDLVWLLLIAQFLFQFGFTITNSISNFILSKTGFNISIDLVSKYLHKVINLPIKYFDTRFNSDLIQRLDDQERINSFITNTVNSMTINFLNILVFSGILLYFDPFLYLIFVLASVISYLYTLFFMERRKYIDYSLFSLESERRNSIYETIMGMFEIKINNAQNIRVMDWGTSQKKINKLNMKSIFLDTYFSEGVAFIGNLKNIIISGLCAFLVIQEKMTIGTMMTASFLIGQLSGPVNHLLSFSKTIQDTKLSFDRISDILDRPDEGSDKGSKISNLRDEVSFNNVDFKYSGSSSPLILKNIDLKIVNGKMTAIVGVSGSGKTTLLKLLLGFYFPVNGELMIGNKNIEQINVDSWRDKCGVVMQDGYIFSGTIANNITISEEKPNIERLMQATKIACLDDFIQSLPMNYSTRIGENGLPLSGGQKQRILIARAVYKDPEFIMLDEATNSLDANNERQIMKNLGEFIKNKTVVVIAHRLSTVQNADKIVVLDEGRIIEEGTHLELSKLKGAYYKLVKNQLELGA